MDIDVYIPEFEDVAYQPKFKPWSDWEEQVMKKYYGKVETKLLADKLNRSLNSVLTKASRMGLRF